MDTNKQPKKEYKTMSFRLKGETERKLKEISELDNRPASKEIDFLVARRWDELREIKK